MTALPETAVLTISRDIRPSTTTIINRLCGITGGLLTRRRDRVISNFDNEMPKPRNIGGETPTDRDLYGGLIRLHILHHASQGPVFGLWFIEELGRHGYKLSPGTLYPLLHGLERKGYLCSISERSGKSLRRMYQATPAGTKSIINRAAKSERAFRRIAGGRMRFRR